MNTKSYTEMASFKTFEERFRYLQLNGKVSDVTFGSHRYLNQALYTSPEWKQARNKVILRDDGCDLGDPSRKIYGKILVHHINPITMDDILNRSPIVFDLENLICVTKRTHDAIHYGDVDGLILDPVVRTANDTAPWRNK